MQYVKPTIDLIGHVVGEALANHSKTSTRFFDLPLILADWKALLQQEILLGPSQSSLFRRPASHRVLPREFEAAC
jgi:hypothetical protein